MRHNSETTAGFVRTEYTPGRLADLRSDVAVPIAQGAAVGIALGAAAGVIVLVFGFGLDGWQRWAMAGKVTAGAAVLATAAAIVWLVIDHRRHLWERERWLDRDLDGDGVIGEPERVRVELHDANNKQTRYVDLPLSLPKLKALAVAVLLNGKTLSRTALRGVLSQTEYNRTAKEMVRRGLARDLPGNKRELTAAGRAVLRRTLDL